jgi:hypothetical protein
MTTLRRRLVRPPASSPAADPQRQRRLHKLRSRLETERQALARWMSKLRRAFHAVERLQTSVSRVERQISHLEDT